MILSGGLSLSSLIVLLCHKINLLQLWLLFVNACAARLKVCSVVLDRRSSAELAWKFEVYIK